MPLTIAHPVAVLPFRRTALPLAALVAGSMAPDLEHFLYLAPMSYFSHTLPGLFLFCLPVGFLMLGLFYWLWAPAFSPYISPPGYFTPPRLNSLLAAAGIVAGAATHIAWDSFTHEYGFGVLRFPALSATLWEGHWYALPVFKLLQHGSSLLGLGILGLLALHLRRQWPSVRPSFLLALLAFLLLAGAAAAASVLVEKGFPNAIRGLGKYIGASIVRFAFITLGGLTLFGLIAQFRKRPAPSTPE